MKITSIDTALEAIDKIHMMGVEKVVLTSAQVRASESVITLIGSHQMGETVNRFTIDIPKIPFNFTGTGDALTALILAYSSMYPSFNQACEYAISSLQGIMKNTWEFYCEKLGSLEKEKKDISQSEKNHISELRLIQSQKEILQPTLSFHSRPVSSSQ